MIFGILKERQPDEYRVALDPAGVERLVSEGHRIQVERDAGTGAGFLDVDYGKAGAQAGRTLSEVFGACEFILKVKAPVAGEYAFFRRGQIIMGYLKAEFRPDMVGVFLDRSITSIAMERITAADGSFPLLRPMSVIAGQQAVLQGMQFLCNHHDGPGISLARCPGVEPARVVILGAGQAGWQAAQTAGVLGAEVLVFEKDSQRRRALTKALPENVRLLDPEKDPPADYAKSADMLINATAIASGEAPLIRRQDVEAMKKKSVIVDVSANIHGAVETVDRLSTHEDPVWQVKGVTHYAVANIPGSVANTASRALSFALTPYLLRLARQGIVSALEADPGLRRALVTHNGQLAGVLTA